MCCVRLLRERGFFGATPIDVVARVEEELWPKSSPPTLDVLDFA